MPMTELHERLNTAAGNRSYRHLAELTETNPETARRYMQGQPPSVEFLSAFCASLAINGEWLLTGRGPMRTADLRKAALRDAEASELLSAMARTIETLIDRVDRLELLMQMLEVRLRAAPLPTTLKETLPHAQDPRAPEQTDRVRVVADALPKRSPPADR
ncbi:hypothetical protein MNBD_PLANCTO03-44 [hydrothermal vent metagenome]|uniref:Uncharacterized protein n=1 Tax=hydrothermal vent metagenome TaxID=652676 RepID=A0A3B1DSR0_9ZZZZ